MLVAQKLQRDNPAYGQKDEPQDYAELRDEKQDHANPGFNFVARHKEDGTLKDIEVLDERANGIEHYEVTQTAGGPSLTLLRNNSYAIWLLLN